MSAPPHLIHIKRKRGDEDVPVTYLQLEPGSKRQLAGSSWVYRRRVVSARTTSGPGAGFSNAHTQTKPIIQTSKPGDEISSPKRAPAAAAPRTSPPHDVPPVYQSVPERQVPGSTTSPEPQLSAAGLAEPRRFHMSRSAMSSSGSSTIVKAGGVSKRGRYGTAVFVERGKRKTAKKLFDAVDADKNARTASNSPTSSVDIEMGGDGSPAPKKPLAKRPHQTTAADVASQRKPMPSAVPTEDMSKIAADMDQWVLHEIGLNIRSMVPQAPSAVSPSRFKPKAPTKRFAERNPDLASQLNGSNRDESMTDPSEGDDDDDDDDYVIEVYELAPSKPLLANIPPEQIGVLRFDSQEDMELFYGNDEDDSDYDDDEDENAENHYTADYPEEEVDSDDEFNRQAYHYRNANASDDEEFDVRDQEDDEDDDMYVMDGDERRDEDELFQEKIRRYIRQHGSH